MKKSWTKRHKSGSSDIFPQNNSIIYPHQCYFLELKAKQSFSLHTNSRMVLKHTVCDSIMGEIAGDGEVSRSHRLNGRRPGNKSIP